MENYQFWTLVGMLAAGFGWTLHQIRDVDRRLSNVDTRITVIETVLAMMGMPIKDKKS